MKKITGGGEKLIIDRNRGWDDSHARENEIK